MKHSQILSKVFQIAKQAGGEARFVGGAVRDFILRNTPLEQGDVDLAINLPVESVSTIFKKAGAKVITKYATNIVIFQGRVFEITSTRRDENCNGRHADMIFTPSFEEDSKRRDFTINALYMNEGGDIFDFHGGMPDLKAKKVRFIGNPEYRIEEDYLRIWRFFRFFCLYGSELDEDGFKACSKKKDGLSKISKERVTSEMLKLLTGSADKIKFTISKMIEAGILNPKDWHLQTSLPQTPFERLLVLNAGDFCSNFLYTAKQKKFINLYNNVRFNLKQKHSIYMLFYTLESDVFTSLTLIAKSLGEMENFNFTNLPKIPFSIQDIISEGFMGADISKEFQKRLEVFCKSIQ